jgi:adenylate kinase family enzyme
MNHSFNVEIAKKYGIEKAILLENFYFWIAKNKANKKNVYDGKSYTYNTAEAFEELFPYMKARKISQLLREMEQENLLLSRQFGKYDRTKSYTLTDYALSLFVQSNIPKLDNERYQNLTMKDTKIGCCLNTDINTNIDTDINTDKEPAKAYYPQEAEELSDLLYTLHKEVDSKYKADWKRWEADIDKLNRIDGRSWEEIKSVIKWCKTPNNFWFPNICSGKKLREKFATMKAQMMQPKKEYVGKPAFRIASDNVTLKDGEINF